METREAVAEVQLRFKRASGGLVSKTIVAVDVVALGVALVVFGEVTQNSVLLVAAAVFLLSLGGHYRQRLTLSVLDEAMSIAGRITIALALGSAYREFITTDVVVRSDRLTLLIGASACVLLGRTVAYQVLRTMRRRGWLLRATTIVASPDQGAVLDDIMRQHPEYGLRPREGDEECCVMIVEFAADAALAEDALVMQASNVGASVFVLPRSVDPWHSGTGRLESFWNVPVLELEPPPFVRSTWVLKRVFDVVVSIIVLFVATPLIIACAIGVAIECKGQVLFRQIRVGLDGTEFTMVKFRTIVPGADVESDSQWTVDADEIGRVGRFMRKWSLDELPQLINVLRGEMSIVGPRPERPHFVQQYGEVIPDYDLRHRVPGGMTGLAQVHGLRGDTSISDRVRFDNAYISNWRFGSDVKILIRTFTSTFTKHGD